MLNLSFLLAQFFLLVAPICAAQAQKATPVQERVTIFAAISLSETLKSIGDAFTATTGIQVRFSFAASSTLARQIEQGAPADLFVSADTDWMAYLSTKQLIAPESMQIIATNRLVLIAPRASAMLPFPLDKSEAIVARLGANGRVAMGDPDHVPAGRYGLSALRWLGQDQAVMPRLARAENTISALKLVARGEAPLGIVYATDAVLEPNVSVLATFPPEAHAPIHYPAARVQAGNMKTADAFLAFLATDSAKAIFKAGGFGDGRPQ